MADKRLSGFVILQVNHQVITVTSPYGKSGNVFVLPGDTSYQEEVAALKAGVHMLGAHDVCATHVATEPLNMVGNLFNGGDTAKRNLDNGFGGINLDGEQAVSAGYLRSVEGFVCFHDEVAQSRFIVAVDSLPHSGGEEERQLCNVVKVFHRLSCITEHGC